MDILTINSAEDLEQYTKAEIFAEVLRLRAELGKPLTENDETYRQNAHE